MKDKTKKILAGACLGLVGMGCLTGCNKDNDLQSTYNLTVINDSQYGIISPVLDNETNSVTVDRGDDYTFTITPREGYEIDNLIIDGNLVEPQSIYTFTDIKSDHSIGAIYSRTINSFSVVGMEFWAYYKHSYDYVEQNPNGDLSYDLGNLKLRISQVDHGTQFLQEENNVIVSELGEEQIYIGRSSSEGTFVNHISVVGGGLYQGLKFANYNNNDYDYAEFYIECFINEANRPNVISDDGYFAFYSTHGCEDTNISKFDSIHENLFKISVGQENETAEVMTTDGKAIILENISLICKANY